MQTSVILIQTHFSIGVEMWKTGVIFFLFVAVTARAKPEDVQELNLKSIFRTPKDFSKANFDHFEILERSNFDDKSDEATSAPSETVHAEDKAAKSVANAQVMLRFGGDGFCNTHGGNSHHPYNSAPYSYSYPMYQNYAPSYPAVTNNYSPNQFTIGSHGKVQRDEYAIETPIKGNQILQEEPVNSPCQHNADSFVVESSAPVQHIHEFTPPQSIAFNTIQTTQVNPDVPINNNVAYAEVNLADMDKSCVEYSDDNIGTLLDQSSIPLSSQKNTENQVLVSYPSTSDNKAPQQEIIVNDIPSTDSCDGNNPDVPYGQKFSKDVDSLIEIASDDQENRVPSTLYNEAPPEGLIKVYPPPPPEKITILTEGDGKKSEWVFETSDSKNKQDTVVIAQSNSCSDVATEPVQQPQVEIINQHEDKAVQTDHTYPETEPVVEVKVPSERQEVVEVSRPCGTEKIFEVGHPREDVIQVDRSHGNEQVVFEVSHPQQETIQRDSPCRIQEGFSFQPTYDTAETVVPTESQQWLQPSTYQRKVASSYSSSYQPQYTTDVFSNPIQEIAQQPPTYFDDFGTNSISFDFSGYGSDQSNAYLDEYGSKCSSSFYTNPTTSVSYSPLSSDSVTSVSYSPFYSEPATSVSYSPSYSDSATSVSYSPSFSEPSTSVSYCPSFSGPATSVSYSPSFSEPATSVSYSSLFSDPSTSVSYSPSFSEPATSLSYSSSFSQPSTYVSYSPSFSEPETSVSYSPSFSGPATTVSISEPSTSYLPSCFSFANKFSAVDSYAQHHKMNTFTISNRFASADEPDSIETRSGCQSPAVDHSKFVNPILAYLSNAIMQSIVTSYSPPIENRLDHWSMNINAPTGVLASQQYGPFIQNDISAPRCDQWNMDVAPPRIQYTPVGNAPLIQSAPLEKKYDHWTMEVAPKRLNYQNEYVPVVHNTFVPSQNSAWPVWSNVQRDTPLPPVSCGCGNYKG